MINCAVSLSRDNRYLAEAGTKGLIHIWDLENRKIVREIQAHRSAVYALSSSPNPDVLASASADKTVCFWNPLSGLAYDKRIECEGEMRCIAFSDNYKIMVAGGDPRKVTVWSMNNSWELLLTMTGHPLTVRSVAISPNAKTIATACDDEKVRLWDAETGQQFYALLGHSARINAVAFSPDGKTLASCDHKGKILLWKTGDSVQVPVVTGR